MLQTYNTAIKPSRDYATRSQPRNRAMKIGLIDTHLARQQAIHSALQPTRFECVPLFLSRQVFEAIDLQGINLLMVGSHAHDMPGLSLVRTVRERVGPGMAIVYLADGHADSETADALNHGADLCFQGEIRPPELLARLDALIRRFAVSRAVRASEIQLGPYTIDRQNRAIRLRDTLVSVHAREFELALLLFANAGRVLSRADIELALWGRELSPYSRTLDTHVSRLRKKLLLGPENGLRLRAIYGQGFCLERVMETVGPN
ncbi:Sensory transduction protein regX3 [Ralstonia mannitolilytica]|jgi:DNA-binding response OmpR family regulator|uniref:Sensory transduction protein regX3 n=2 Tax=Ralstonia mannitolilytica TaxID=105219 RepID=A0AAD2AL86_9RALS|nr:Sensory transduction protein regX3 [Ralstonia mannitolilytica]CAJ0682324.1 Sensory transduction protein regX3 [Ralstonia mannitolilytica]CAJ0688483.1 Sensory transduction protein regX3 [Ralstonia mannitolilytica]CAJ0709781.1 Sensory transduction protein regX3 [Ralstonia mannitolilytica]CAJ0740983.1 Sensory transduction protein regX3 [Ralstonia mannitolilytica]